MRRRRRRCKARRQCHRSCFWPAVCSRLRRAKSKFVLFFNGFPLKHAILFFREKKEDKNNRNATIHPYIPFHFLFIFFFFVFFLSSLFLFAFSFYSYFPYSSYLPFPFFLFAYSFPLSFLFFVFFLSSFSLFLIRILFSSFFPLFPHSFHLLFLSSRKKN